MKRYKWLLAGSAVLCLAIVLVAGCGVSQEDYDALQADYDVLQAENADLTAELAVVQLDLNSLQADYDAVSAELAQIQAVYPPRDFDSISDLEDWLLENDVSDKPITVTFSSWYGRALEVQEDALADGYIVSADYDYDAQLDYYFVYCVAIINGDIYYWDPETDDVFHDPGLTRVK